MTEETEQRGAVIRGADGSVYLVPQDVLEQHEVAAEAAEQVSRTFDELEVAGFDYSFTAQPLSQFDVPIVALPAFDAPIVLGPRPSVMSNAPTRKDLPLA